MIFIFNSSRLMLASRRMVRTSFFPRKLVVAILAIWLMLLPSLIFGTTPTSQTSGAMQKNITAVTQLPTLTQQQWNDLFTDYAKQIVSLQTQFDYHSIFFVSNADAQIAENALKSSVPSSHVQVPVGYKESNQLVKLH